jgi:hypothetical protein
VAVIRALDLSSEKDDRKDIDKLSGLKQAIAIATRLSNGEKLSDLIKDAKGDEQIVMIWVNFLRELKWLEESQDGVLVVTSIGHQGITKYRQNERESQ